ncbi:MAG: LacI family transcriptional regulator [Bacteroidetes bacterium]|nr:LacI family transcriptional regulator [Bacteroidota bacterium]MBU1422581.1 LacI family transcriptional regulator [Bacteroidota bacterium]MBU2637282.1 LacI family transcriptional regulator [Bacteroidota bacterium]
MTKRVTIKQIADELGVSMMTVSRALNSSPKVNKATREKVLRAAERSDYFPNYIARSLVTARTRTFGVVVPEITHSFFPEAIRGIEEVAYSSGYQIILTHCAEDANREISAIETLVSKRVDGILASVAEQDTDFEIYHRVLKWGLRVVFFDRCVFKIGASCVSVNDEECAYTVTRHLIGHRYKKIAHLRGPLLVSISERRLTGFLKALKENNLKPKEEWIIEAGFHEEGGYNAMSKLLNLPMKDRPRAVVAVNDPAAFGAMEAIYEKGLRIPEDIAIVGFSDDIRAPLMPSPLTTIQQPAYEVGKRAAQKLIRHIENRSEVTENITIQTKLIVRNSCGCKSKTNNFKVRKEK